MEIKQEYMQYLDKLRNSGETNMFGARPYLERRFGLSTDEAKLVLMHWMDRFRHRYPNADKERRHRMRQ